MQVFWLLLQVQKSTGFNGLQPQPDRVVTAFSSKLQILCARTHHACHDVAVTCFDSWIAVQFCKKVCWHFNGWHLQYFRFAVSSIEKTFGLVHCKRCVSLPPLEVWVMGQTSLSYLMKRRHRFSSPSEGYLGTGRGCQKPCLEWSTILHQAVKSHQHPLFPLGVSSLEIFNF